MNPRYQKLWLVVIALFGLTSAPMGWGQAGSPQTASPQPASAQRSSVEMASSQTTPAKVQSQANDETATNEVDADADLLKPGIVVEEVTPGYGAARAGLQKGDVLLSWSRGDQSGKFESPFDFMWVDIEQRPRGVLTLQGLRGKEEHTWKIFDYKMGATSAPNFSVDFQDSQGAAPATARLIFAESPRARLLPWLPTWLLMSAGELFADSKQWKEADSAFASALSSAPESDHQLRSYLLLAWGDAALKQDDLEPAAKTYRRALGEAKKARSLLQVAKANRSLAWLETQRGDYSRAKAASEEALLTLKNVSPESPDVASLLINIAISSFYLGDLAAADDYLQESEKILLSSGSTSSLEDYILHGRGVMAQYRGELAKAEDSYRQVLLLPSLDPMALVCKVASLENLGNVAWYRGDLKTSLQFFQQAFELSRQTDPGGVFTADSLDGLAMVTRELGDYSKAQAFAERALMINQKADKSGVYLAQNLNTLGQISESRGQLLVAQQYYLRAYKTLELKFGNAWAMAETTQHLGHLMLRQGELDKASYYYSRAVSILEALGSYSITLADSIAALGDIARQQDRPTLADQKYRRALSVLDGQVNQLGGTQNVRADFRAQHTKYYSDYADLLVSQHRLSAAFDVLERSRARTLLETLAAAQVNINKGADAALLERERNLRAEIHAKSERRIQLLGAKQTKEQTEQVKEVDKEISNLLSQLQDVESALRATSPGYSALTQPQPLSAKQVQQQLLDSDTVLLEYSLGTDRSHVFAVTPTSLVAVALPRRAVIEKAARRVYDLLTARNHPVKGETPEQQMHRLAQAEAEYPAAAAELSRMVLGPVAAQLSTGSVSARSVNSKSGGPGTSLGVSARRRVPARKPRRLLIVADGALQYIPFALLPEPTSASTTSTAAPLVVQHEVVNLPSASVLAVLREQEKGRQPAAKAVAVIADPVFDQKDSRLAASHRTRAPSPTLAAGLTAPVPQGPGERNPNAWEMFDRGPRYRDRNVWVPRTLPITQSSQSLLNNAAWIDDRATDDLLTAYATQSRTADASHPGDDALDLLSESTSAHLLTRSATDLGLSRDGQLSLPRLLYSRQEADAIRAVTPADGIKEAVDFDATRAVAMSAELRNYRIVHFATHGLLNSEHPELSGLVFSLVDQNGQPQDGFLQLEDIYNLDLPADLVVLSACETGLGKEINGEGLIGLTRGFMYAGATRVVASLWNVSDVATAQLMAEFYRAMEKDHLPPAAALRAAQIHMWKQKRWASPYYWAAFQIQGEWK